MNHFLLVAKYSFWSIFRLCFFTPLLLLYFGDVKKFKVIRKAKSVVRRIAGSEGNSGEDVTALSRAMAQGCYIRAYYYPNIMLFHSISVVLKLLYIF